MKPTAPGQSLPSPADNIIPNKRGASSSPPHAPAALPAARFRQTESADLGQARACSGWTACQDGIPPQRISSAYSSNNAHGWVTKGTIIPAETEIPGPPAQYPQPC